MDRAETIKTAVAKAEAASVEAYSTMKDAAALLIPALVAVHTIRNYEVEEVSRTMHLSGGYNVKVSFNDGDTGEYFIPDDIAHAENPADAAAAYYAAKRERQRVQDAERLQADRLKSYRDAGLSPEDINTIESARIALAVVGKSL